ncbi:hypothetical protein FQZ97_1123010 [compost metagenome]
MEQRGALVEAQPRRGREFLQVQAQVVRERGIQAPAALGFVDPGVDVDFEPAIGGRARGAGNEERFLVGVEPLGRPQRLHRCQPAKQCGADHEGAAPQRRGSGARLVCVHAFDGAMRS